MNGPGQRRANPEDASGDHEGIADAARPAMAVRSPGDPAWCGLVQGEPGEAEKHKGNGAADHYLESGEEDGAHDVEVQPQHLVDRPFEGSRQERERR